MSAQNVTKSLGDRLSITSIVTKDASGNPCQGVSYSLNVISGDPTGIPLTTAGLGAPYITCTKVGTYQVELVATNQGGVLATDESGDIGVPDTINVVVPPPASQTFVYV